MSKIHEWEVPVDGKLYLVSCRENGNKYEFFCDDRLLSTLWRNGDEIQERDVKIGGKCCQVVLQGEDPDVSVDGVLMGVLEAERKSERMHRLSGLFIGFLLLFLGSMALYSFVALTVTKQYFLGGWVSLIPGLGFVIGGIWLIRRCLMRKNGF